MSALNVLDAVAARTRNSDLLLDDAKLLQRKKRLSAYIDEAPSEQQQQQHVDLEEEEENSEDFLMDVVRKRATRTHRGPGSSEPLMVGKPGAGAPEQQEQQQEEARPFASTQSAPSPPALIRRQDEPGAFAEGRGRSCRGRRRNKASLSSSNHSIENCSNVSVNSNPSAEDGFRDEHSRAHSNTELPEHTSDSEESDLEASKSHFDPLTKMMAVVVLLVLGIGVVVGVFLVGQKSNTGGMDDATQKDDSQPAVGGASALLEQVFSDPSVLPDTTMTAINSGKPNTPQKQALNWLASDPNLDLYSAEQKTQRLALATIYYATNGPSWLDDWASVSNPWLDYQLHECEWFSLAQYGVGSEPCANYFTTGSDQYQHTDYTSLELNGGYQGFSPALKGILPPQLGLLTELESINLGHQQLKGSIPTELARLSSTLGTIVLEDAFFTGTIPGAFFEFAWVLKFDRNPRLEKGTIPTTVGLNTGLTVLSLIETNQMGSVPTELFQAPRLQQLFLNENSMTGTLPTQVGLLGHALQDIDLSSNRFTGSMPSEVGLLDRLQYLYLDKNQFKGTLATELGALTSLLQFGIFYNHISGTIPSQIGSWTAISYLTLGKNKLTGTLPTSLSRLSELEILDVAHNSIGGSIPLGLITSIANGTSSKTAWQKLVHLGVNNNQMTGTVPSEVGLLVSLQRLWLASNDFVSTLPSQLGALGSLQELQLEATDVTGNVPDEICSLPLQSFLVDCNRLECPPACRCVCK